MRLYVSIAFDHAARLPPVVSFALGHERSLSRSAVWLTIFVCAVCIRYNTFEFHYNSLFRHQFKRETLRVRVCARERTGVCMCVAAFFSLILSAALPLLMSLPLLELLLLLLLLLYYNYFELFSSLRSQCILVITILCRITFFHICLSLCTHNVTHTHTHSLTNATMRTICA